MRTVPSCDGVNGSSARDRVLKRRSISRSDRSTRSRSYRKLGEESFGPALVGFDLRAEGVDVFEFALVAEAQYEPEPHAVSVEVGVIPEDMGFDRGLRRIAERRPHPDVGDA